ncbi:hypothetical protein GCM10011581_23350 [Saccharopolyspora subtropica]|uniref:Amidohydrolase 3 domain-containing protein n=1 Tax=Saccharopolyspora thermophila TaxID=89367 RepID=A0A917NB88_9PSEU|nr:hypothetical protein GCM10011581_23350 [Saccharopolyspora subtropica]
MREVAFVGGRVATMDAARSFTDAVLVRDGRITAVGHDAVRDRATPSAELVDLRGRLLLPGFHDAHVHPVFGGMQRLRCDLTDSTDARDCLRRIAEHRRTTSGWVLGGGWDMAQFPGGTPTRADLDAVTGDRPAYLVNRDHHGAWVNSAALRLAGIDRRTPDPPDGRIERDADGEPAGTLHEGATRLVERVLPPTGPDECLAGLLEGQRHLHHHGVTSWHDAIVGPYLGYPDILDTYLTADRRGLLTGRVRGALWWDRTRGRDQVDELRQRAGGPAAAGSAPMRSRSCRTGCARTSRPRCCCPTSARTAAGCPSCPPRTWPPRCGSSPTRASSCTSTPSATGRSATCWTRSPGPGAPGCATRSRTCRSCSPVTSPGSTNSA